jgi:hypothetical protein
MAADAFVSQIGRNTRSIMSVWSFRLSLRSENKIDQVTAAGNGSLKNGLNFGKMEEKGP